MKQWPWDKNKITNLPDPEGEKGGSDDQLGVASEAVADAEAEQNPYVPPLPVPLSRQTELKAGSRGLTEPAWLLNPPAALPGLGAIVGIGGNSDQDADYPINTVRVDNLTRQWLYFPEVQVWVPPLWLGRVFRYNGSHRRKAIFETPAGMTALTLSTSEVAAVTFYQEILPEVDGEQISSSVISGVLGAVAIAGDAGQAQTAAANVDATVATVLGLITNGRMYAFNGVTWDRVRTSGNSSGYLGIVVGGLSGGGGFAAVDGGGYLSDASATTASVLKVMNHGFGYNGATWDRLRVPKVFKQMASVAIGAGSAVTVWTPAAGLKPRLMGWIASPSSALLVPAAVTFFETSTTGTFMGDTGFMSSPSTPETHTYGPSGPIVSTSSAVIVAFSSTGLTLRGTLWGTEE